VVAACCGRCHLEDAFRNRSKSQSLRPNLVYLEAGVDETSMLQSPEQTHSRRQFLFCASTLSLAGLFPLRLSAQRTGHEERQKDGSELDVIPRDSLLKFTADGSIRPFAEIP